MDQVSIKYTSIFHCKTLLKFTQIWIFGLKTNLATLPVRANSCGAMKVILTYVGVLFGGTQDLGSHPDWVKVFL
jgi:hypothetical protein